MIRIAILDLYEGHPNQGMRCIRELVKQWGQSAQLDVILDEFDVRQKLEVPDMSYDVYFSSGGPGSPLESEGSEWEACYFNWLNQVENWNNDPLHQNKKSVLFICHSFQLACRHYKIGHLNKRKSTSFGVYPVHVTWEGQQDLVFQGLNDPFYVVDSRDYQVVHPEFDLIDAMGAKILCIEKYRPHVPYAQAIMAMRFNQYMIGTQFHPEADAIGMSLHLQTEERKKVVIENHGEEKWRSMVEQLNDPDKILYTHDHVIPNFLNQALQYCNVLEEARK
jgi:GMP synthase-like glutamine amidotransferase